MNVYQKPEMEVIIFCESNVIVTSGVGDSTDLPEDEF